jgi:hypothetical protein
VLGEQVPIVGTTEVTEDGEYSGAQRTGNLVTQYDQCYMETVENNTPAQVCHTGQAQSPNGTSICQDGDSGGPVYIRTTPLEGVYAVGIHIAGNGDVSQGNGQSTLCQFQDIDAALKRLGNYTLLTANPPSTKCSTDSGANSLQIKFTGTAEATFHVETCLQLFQAGTQASTDYWVPQVKIWIGDGDDDYPPGGPFAEFTITVYLQDNNKNIYTFKDTCLPQGTDPLLAINDFNNPAETQFTSANSALICGDITGAVATGLHSSANDYTTDGMVSYQTDGSAEKKWEFNGSPGYSS